MVHVVPYAIIPIDLRVLISQFPSLAERTVQSAAEHRQGSQVIVVMPSHIYYRHYIWPSNADSRRHKNILFFPAFLFPSPVPER